MVQTWEGSDSTCGSLCHNHHRTTAGPATQANNRCYYVVTDLTSKQRTENRAAKMWCVNCFEMWFSTQVEVWYICLHVTSVYSKDESSWIFKTLWTLWIFIWHQVRESTTFLLYTRTCTVSLLSYCLLQCKQQLLTLWELKEKTAYTSGWHLCLSNSFIECEIALLVYGAKHNSFTVKALRMADVYVLLCESRFLGVTSWDGLF